MHPALFAIAYIIAMLFTYVLPWLGSNSAAVNTVTSAQGGGMNPFFWVHAIVWLILIGLAYARGKAINQAWLIILPILGAVFDLVPGLNWIPLIPTALNIACIICGVALRPRPATA